MPGLSAMWDDQDLQRFFDKFQGEAEEKIIKLLSYAGEEFVRLARLQRTYRDRTGNLRSSIGYAIVSDGDLQKVDIREAEKGTDKKTGVQKARQLIEEIAQDYNTGWVLVGVAGMDYALYVENIAGKDVISSSAINAEKIMREVIREVIN